jgi:P27 family predicted phage terminase small subunit
MPGVAGRSGRKPKPTAIKVAAGNLGKRKLNTAEPDFGLVKNIDCPEWLTGHAREMWELQAPLLCKQQVLQATDVQNLIAYCAVWGNYRAAQDELTKNGPVVEGAQGGPTKNPAATVVKESLTLLNSYSALLGLDPSSRQRLHGPKSKKKGNEWAALED